MPEWRRTINIKDHLDPDKPLAEVRDPVVTILQADLAYHTDPEFIWAVDAMANSDTVSMFDEALTSLYDWADYNRVWIGGAPAYRRPAGRT